MRVPAAAGLVAADRARAVDRVLAQVTEGICPRCDAALSEFPARSRATGDRCVPVRDECGSHAERPCARQAHRGRTYRRLARDRVPGHPTYHAVPQRGQRCPHVRFGIRFVRVHHLAGGVASVEPRPHVANSRLPVGITNEGIRLAERRGMRRLVVAFADALRAVSAGVFR